MFLFVSSWRTEKLFFFFCWCVLIICIILWKFFRRNIYLFLSRLDWLVWIWRSTWFLVVNFVKSRSHSSGVRSSYSLKKVFIFMRIKYIHQIWVNARCFYFLALMKEKIQSKKNVSKRTGYSGTDTHFSGEK